jgi:hypothetical protein
MLETLNNLVVTKIMLTSVICHTLIFPFVPSNGDVRTQQYGNLINSIDIFLFGNHIVLAINYWLIVVVMQKGLAFPCVKLVNLIQHQEQKQ